MASLRDFLSKEAAGKKPDPYGWSPDWTPPGGWKSQENPTGWKKPRKASQQKELYLWHRWKEQGETPEAASPLMKSLRPLIYRYGVQQYAGRVPLHPTILKAEANRLALGGLRQYDPTKAQINTFLRHELMSTNRFVKKRQNFSRITESRAGMIGDLDRATARLRDRLGREPTLLELSDEMKQDPKTVERLLQERKSDLLASGALEDPFVNETPKSRRVLRLLRYELTPTEEQVFNYITGAGGKPKLERTGQIAKALGWTDSKVSHVKKSIAKKVQRYL